MDVAARRREARRRRLLQDPEERLRKIRDLKCGGGENSSPDHGVAHREDLSPVAPEEAASAQPHDDTTEPVSLQHSGDTDHGAHHPYPQTPDTLGGGRTSEDPPPRTHSSNDPSSSIQNFIFSQLFMSSGVDSGFSGRTLAMCVVAVLFRLLLEWSAAYTGQSLVVVFAVAYMPLVFFFGGRNPLRSAARFVLWLVQDFALYLFSFIVTHGLVSAFMEQETDTGPGT